MSSADPAAAARPAQPYRGREPERTLLYETVRAHWKTLLAETEQRNDGAGLPRFVAAEFERYLGCGIRELQQALRRSPGTPLSVCLEFAVRVRCVARPRAVW